MTDDTLRTVFAPRVGLVVEAFDDAVLIWDGECRRLHCLDMWAAVIWEELDGRREIGQIASELAEELGISRARLAADISAVARRLVREGLVTATT